MESSGGLYAEYIDNFEITMTPYITLDTIRNEDDCYIARINKFVLRVYEYLKTTKEHQNIKPDEVMTLINSNQKFKFKLARTKHAELMSLLARFSLLPIPQITDIIDADEFEPIAETQK